MAMPYDDQLDVEPEAEELERAWLEVEIHEHTLTVLHGACPWPHCRWHSVPIEDEEDGAVEAIRLQYAVHVWEEHRG